MKKKETNNLYNFLKTRTIILASAIDENSSEKIIQELIMLENDNNNPIKFIICSPGGQVNSGLAIYDIMQAISSPVHTIASGLAASMSSILLIGGAKNHCEVTKNCRIMIHQPLIQGVSGKTTDLMITASEMEKTKQQIVSLYQKKTGKNANTITKDIDKDNWFSAEEAVAYGLADKIINKIKF